MEMIVLAIEIKNSASMSGPQDEVYPASPTYTHTQPGVCYTLKDLDLKHTHMCICMYLFVYIMAICDIFESRSLFIAISFCILQFLII